MPLSEKDYQNAATSLGVPVTAVKAVAEVEANGDGFLPDGRPKILFERHIFRKRLIAKGVSTANTTPDIFNTSAGGYLGGTKEHDRLDKAAKIDRECALESCSWGAFQIMGYHWKALGYPSLQAFINAMYKDAGSQLDAFVRFIKADNRLLTALRKLDWATFARLYNGPEYAKHNYDGRMATAYKKAGGV